MPAKPAKPTKTETKPLTDADRYYIAVHYSNDPKDIARAVGRTVPEVKRAMKTIKPIVTTPPQDTGPSLSPVEKALGPQQAPGVVVMNMGASQLGDSIAANCPTHAEIAAAMSKRDYKTAQRLSDEMKKFGNDAGGISDFFVIPQE